LYSKLMTVSYSESSDSDSDASLAPLYLRFFTIVLGV
jgi:hypothetical protein